MTELAVISAIFGLVVTIIWIVIGWRAMRAHERIAEAASLWIFHQRSARRENAQDQPSKAKRPEDPSED